MTANTGQEIDLQQLFIQFLKYLKRYFWIFLVALALGVGLGIIKCRTSEKLFSSRMVVSTAHISVYHALGMINTIDRLIKDGNHEQIATLLSMDPEQARSLREIMAEAIVDVPEREPNRLEITVVIRENDILPDLSAGLKHYVNTNPYTKTRNDLYRESSQELIRELEQKIRDIDEMQKGLNESIAGNRNQTYVLGLNEEMGMPSRWLEFYKEKQMLERNMVLLEPFMVIEDFQPFQQPRKKLLIYCVINSLVFLGLAFLYSLARELYLFMKRHGI